MRAPTLYFLYQGVYGVSIAVAKKELRAILANKADARTLKLAPGTPLLQMNRIAAALDAQSVEWRVSLCNTSDLVDAVDVN